MSSKASSALHWRTASTRQARVKTGSARPSQTSRPLVPGTEDYWRSNSSDMSMTYQSSDLACENSVDRNLCEELNPHSWIRSIGTDSARPVQRRVLPERTNASATRLAGQPAGMKQSKTPSWETCTIAKHYTVQRGADIRQPAQILARQMYGN